MNEKKIKWQTSLRLRLERRSLIEFKHSRITFCDIFLFVEGIK